MEVISLAKRYAQLKQQYKDARKQMREVKKNMDELETQLVDGMTQNGVQSLEVEGKKLYLSTTMRARAKNKNHARAVRVLQEHGMDDLITLGSQKISAYFRRLDDLDDVPPDVRDAFEIYEQTSINLRSS